MIQLKNVTKEYASGDEKLLALDNVNLTIEDGDMLAIMGTSGSGKTTLLNIIGCMDKLSSGEYFYNEEAVHKLHGKAREQFRREHIGFVFQQFALLNDYTVFENVEIPLLAAGKSKKQRKEIVNGLLEQFGIEKLKDKRPTKISGGQQQRCAIARALAAGNDILLADEPTGALDSKTSAEIMDVLCEVNKAGKTIILVTHDEKVAARANHMVRIEDGKLLA